MPLKRLSLAAVGILAALYLAVPAALLSWQLDRLIFTSQKHDATHEAQRFDVSMAPDATVLVRRYGNPGARCLYFFPGEHGGMGTYEETLFPSLLEFGTVYAISYPGQDGARGQGHVALLPDQVEHAIRVVSRTARCEIDKSVFVGRSFGATVALLEAERLHPKGVIVDGVGADLPVVVRAWIARHKVFYGWRMLPVEWLLAKQRYSLEPVLTALAPMPIVIFQGTADVVTPFSAAQAVARGHSNVKFYPVTGGRHDNSYVLARAMYLDALRKIVAFR